MSVEHAIRVLRAVLTCGSPREVDEVELARFFRLGRADVHAALGLLAFNGVVTPRLFVAGHDGVVVQQRPGTWWALGAMVEPDPPPDFGTSHSALEHIAELAGYLRVPPGALEIAVDCWAELGVTGRRYQVPKPLRPYAIVGTGWEPHWRDIRVRWTGPLPEGLPRPSLLIRARRMRPPFDPGVSVARVAFPRIGLTAGFETDVVRYARPDDPAAAARVLERALAEHDLDPPAAWRRADPTTIPSRLAWVPGPTVGVVLGIREQELVAWAAGPSREPAMTRARWRIAGRAAGGPLRRDDDTARRAIESVTALAFDSSA